MLRIMIADDEPFREIISVFEETVKSLATKTRVHDQSLNLFADHEENVKMSFGHQQLAKGTKEETSLRRWWLERSLLPATS